MTTEKKTKPVCERCQSTDEDGQVPAGMPVGEAYVVWNEEQQRMVIDDDTGEPNKWYCPICEDEVEVEWVDA
jgi:hypothetical protein